MTRDIAHGRVVIDVDLDKVGAELREAEARFEKTMRSIDRMDADAEVGIDSRGFDREIAKIKEQIAKLNLAEADPRVKLDADEAKLDIKVLRAQLAYLNSQKTTLKIDADEAKAARKEVDRLADAEAARAKLNKKYEDDAAKRYEDRINNIRRESIMRDRANRDNMRFDRDHLASLQTQARVEDQRRKVEAERPLLIAKARIELAKMLAVQRDMDRNSPGRAFRELGLDPKAAMEYDRVAASVTNLRNKLKSLGGSDKGLDKITSEHESDRLRKWATSLGSIRVQMGFFSATLRQAAVGFTALGPVIFAVAGQLISLIGVLGTGLAGALSVGAASLAGFGLSAAGIFFIMKPLVGELKDATAASSAYNDAVRKYGKGSSEAQGKLKQLNTTLGNISPAAKQAFVEFGRMKDQWAQLTSGARKPFFESVGTAINAASKMLPMFARQSTATFGVAAKAADKWSKALSSPAAAAGIESIMTSFRSALPGINSGLLSIGKAFGNIAVSAGKFLPELSQGFAKWGKSLSDATGMGLDATMGRLVDHMQQIGRFASAAGSMIVTFFNSGANSGASLLSTLTQISNRWNSWMQSAAGQQSLSNFFSEASGLGSQFIGSLAQMAVAVFELSSALAPLSSGFVAAVHAAASLVAALMGLAPASGIITALGGALAGAFVAGKLMAAYQAIVLITSAIRTFGASSAAIGMMTASINPFVAALAGIGAVVAVLAMLKANAESAAGGMQTTAQAAVGLKAALDSLNGVTIDAATAQANLTSARLQHNAAIAAYTKLENQGRESTVAGKQALANVVSTLGAVKTARQAYNDAMDRGDKIVKESNKTLSDNVKNMTWSIENEKKLRDEHEKGSSEWVRFNKSIQWSKKELAKYEEQLLRSADAGTMFRTMQRHGLPVSQKVAGAWKNIYANAKEASQVKVANMFEAAPEKAEATMRAFSKLIDAGQKSKAEQIILNPKLNDKQVLAQLRGLQKQVNTNVNVKANTGKAKSDITNLGKGKTATINTKANTKGAEASLRGLSSKRLAAMLTIRANDSDAVGKLNKIQRAKLTAKLVSLGADKSAAEAAVKSVNAKKLNNKTAKFEAKADIGAAESADKKVQGFRDKTVRMRTTADTSGVSSVQSAINSLPSEVVIPVRVSGSASVSRAAGGPVVGAASGRDIGPAAQRRREDSATRANSPANSNGGTYARPTLLVGEENRREYVIATNPAYRQNNVGYLAAAADEFGYRLETAATGMSARKKPKNKNPGKKKNLGQTAAERGMTRTGYDYITDMIQKLTDKSSNRDTRRQADLARTATDTTLGTSSIPLSAVTQPLEDALVPWYDKLKANVKNRMNSANKKANENANSLPGLKDAWKDAKSKVKDIKGRKPDSEKGRAKKAKDLAKAQREADKAKAAVDKAKGLKSDKGDIAAQLWRELKGIDEAKYALRNSITGIEDAEKTRLGTDLTGGGSGTSTPIGIQLGSFDKARYDLFNEFSSNTIGASGTFGAPGGGPPAAPSYYGSPASGGAGGPAAGLSSSDGAGTLSGMSNGGGRGGVVQNITIAEAPPNPHIFTQEMAWEAGAAF